MWTQMPGKLQKQTHKTKNLERGNGFNNDILLCSMDAIWKGLAFNLILISFTYTLDAHSLEAWSCSAHTVICNVNMMSSLEAVKWQSICDLTHNVCLNLDIQTGYLLCNRSKSKSTFHHLQNNARQSRTSDYTLIMLNISWQSTLKVPYVFIGQNSLYSIYGCRIVRLLFWELACSLCQPMCVSWFCLTYSIHLAIKWPSLPRLWLINEDINHVLYNYSIQYSIWGDRY